MVLVRLPSYHGVDALDLARRKSVRSVCFLLCLWDATIGRRTALPKAIYSRAATRMTKSAASKANLVLAQGKQSSRYLKRFGIDSLPVIESPLEAEDFVERDPEAGAWRDGLRVVTISRLVPSKNLPVLIEAIERAQQGGVAVHLKIVGEGELRDLLEQQILRLGMSGRVELLGRIDDRVAIRQILASADVFALPSVEEGVSLSVMEAMAAGLPIVAAPVGGLGDILEAGKNALLVGAPTAEEIADALISLAGDQQRRLDLGMAARDSARGLLHEAWVERFHEIVTDLLLGTR
jgi:glycosyltransferase involved in cell wall biosynthesis